MTPTAPRRRSSASTAGTETARVDRSQSTSAGSAPARLTASAVAMNVLAGTITRSPGRTPSARSASTSASVPEETATQCPTSQAAANSASKAADLLASHERTRVQEAAPGGQDLLAQRRVLRPQVEPGNGGRRSGDGRHAATSSGVCRDTGAPPVRSEASVASRIRSTRKPA